MKMMRDTSHISYRPDIDGLRAVAILSVVLFHAFPEILKGGFVGVDIFFVISGFLISSIIFTELNNGKFSFANFYARRIKRIFPALIAIFTASIVFGWFGLFAHEYQQLGKHTAMGAGFLANFQLYREAGYFDTASELKPLLHLWSLGIEEQFYMAWPLILFAAYKLRVKAIWLVLLIAIPSLGLSIYASAGHKMFSFYLPPTRFWELLVGSGLAYISFYKNNQKSAENSQLSANLQAWFGVALIAAGVFLLDRWVAFPSSWAMLPTFGAFFIISAGKKAWFNHHILSSRVMIFIGIISYPLYLWHWPLLTFARIMEGGTASDAICVAAIIVSFVLAYLTYILIENPIRHLKYATAYLCVAMLLIASIGAYIANKDGFISRFPEFEKYRLQTIRTPASDADCEAIFTQKGEEKLFKYCRFTGNKHKETVAIIGDSHAHVVFQGLAELMAAEHKNVLLLANTSCPTLMGAIAGDSAEDLRTCNSKIEQIIKTVAEREDVKTVLIVTRGASYISGNGFGVAERDLRNRPILSIEQNNETPAQIFRHGLEKTSQSLTASGKKLFYMIENPELGVDAFNCVGRPVYLTKQYDCVIEKATVLARQDEYREVIKNIPNLTLIDVVPAFCPDEHCKVMENGTLLYSDDDHLSVEGSRFLANKVLKKYLLAADKKPRKKSLNMQNAN